MGGGVEIESPCRLELRKEVGGALNRPGDQLREEADEDEELHPVASRLELAKRDVDGVAERLEGEEGDADWKHDVQNQWVPAYSDAAEQRGKAVDEEVEVLEIV